ncbi:cation:proton antiporter [Sedimentibacter sp. zth1]|uniref:cation:proton antiporter domain-containing protein n=1 Tax=Sedimentibacter sp. zth1 TaxID=2816908 RepID=UPI001A938173|nr:cation:proton antiporter [Sedimentibacter sp. zth1]QSX05343.1 cation:proton antiporter [Sedimentibacter sp. zth1]
MLYSLALIFLLGLIFSALFKKINLPSLLGMILVGILIGPYGFNLLDNSILSISAQLRKFALIIILTRAGLTLNISDLKKVGRPAILMSFLPASFEILGIIIIAPILLGVELKEAALIGTVVAAVSPAVVVPRMIKFIDTRWGTNKSIPQLIIASSSMDDVFVIVLFTALSSIVGGKAVSASVLFQIPISIALGIVLGIVAGFILYSLFKKINMNEIVKVLIVLSVSFLLVELENRLNGIVPVSGLLAIMSMGITINYKQPILSKKLCSQYNNLWIAGQILLFVLVGACVNVKYAMSASFYGIIIVLFALVFRIVGVSLCLIKTNLTFKERVFCMIAYTPKATVQAAIGAVPLAMGLDCGQIVLTMAVISILITAPLGAIAIDKSYKKLLTK